MLMVVFFIFIIFIYGCNNANNNVSFETSGQDLNQLLKVDVQKLNLDSSNSKYVTITDKENLILLGKIFGEIEWHRNIEVEMERREDYTISLFYELDKSGNPKVIVEYLIWFNTDETATIILKDGTYGTLDKENVQVLKEILLKAEI